MVGELESFKQWVRDCYARHGAPMTPAQPAPVDHSKAYTYAHVHNHHSNLARAYLALRAENEALKRRNEQHCEAYNEVATALETSKATAARLREALEKFGNHDNGCDHWDGGQCDCGWAALEGAKSHD